MTKAKTARRYSRKARRHPLAILAAIGLVLIAAPVVLAELRAIVVIGLVTAAAWLAYRWHQRHPARPVEPAAAADLAELRRTVARLTSERDAARDGMHAAFDVASSIPPRLAPASDARTRLLSAPLSGARPLSGSDE
jgi:hypothetical protein